jgi:hypothetical protein
VKMIMGLNLYFVHLLVFMQVSYTKFNSSKLFGRGYDPALPPTQQPIPVKVGFNDCPILMLKYK